MWAAMEELAASPRLVPLHLSVVAGAVAPGGARISRADRFRVWERLALVRVREGARRRRLVFRVMADVERLPRLGVAVKAELDQVLLVPPAERVPLRQTRIPGLVAVVVVVALVRGQATSVVPAWPVQSLFKGHEHAYIYSSSLRQGALEVPS